MGFDLTRYSFESFWFCALQDGRAADMAKSQARETIKLRSTESPYVYTTKKNKRNTTERLELKKYDPVVRKHVIFKEQK